ncbi:MAG: PAS domain-containing sensor histidine kinase [Desulfuromonas sp.]|nr:MAG: PAS domain-containing sensor histidine kinase [Desulfuromonas sp.]
MSRSSDCARNSAPAAPWSKPCAASAIVFRSRTEMAKPHRRMVWQIFPPFLAIVLIALAMVCWLFIRSTHTFFLDQTRHNLEIRARLVLTQVTERLPTGSQSGIKELFRQLGKETGTRLTLIAQDGLVIADSEEDPRRMDNHRNRPEVATALQGGIGVATRLSNTLQQEMMYVAIPVGSNEQALGCLRTSLPLLHIKQTLDRILTQILFSALATALLAALASLWVARRLSRPLEEMKRGAERFAEGDFAHRLPDYRGEEFDVLAGAMNQMADQLDERIRTIVRQRNEQEAVLACMVEGVLAIDKQETILRFNQAASSLLNLDPHAAGRRVREVLRKPDLLQFIDRSLSSQTPVEQHVTLMMDGQQRSLQAHGTPLRDARGREIGALLVFNDITRLQRLENIRKDFVANVSHELKTPITAIKGSVETLIDGALNDAEHGQRFLAIIARQSDRLNAIIDDLLALSRIEQGEEREGIERQQASVPEIVQAALQACRIKADQRDISLELETPEQQMWFVNPRLLEQALVNLVDNAIKYSAQGQKVLVVIESNDEMLQIRVRDWGTGIAQEHLPRLFERFYRVDKARSRHLGGTGLGLAIVKHIVQAHHGHISVDSRPGDGSTFTITIPSNDKRSLPHIF